MTEKMDSKMREQAIEDREYVLTKMAHAYDSIEGQDLKTTKERPRSQKDERAMPSIDIGEAIALKGQRIAGLARGLPMNQHDLDMGYSRDYIIYMLSTQINHLARNKFKESFTYKKMQGEAERSL